MDFKEYLDGITDRQKLIIRKGLCDYRYILHNWEKNDEDFQKVYYDFYLKSGYSRINKGNNRKIYFDMLQKPENDLMQVVKKLHDEMEGHSYEFSFATKLLHTRNPKNPIFDNKVRLFLLNQGNELWWNRKSSYTHEECIKHDWDLLVNWYNQFLASKDGKLWLRWFKAEFPDYQGISDYKKIDFIIYATN